MRKVILALIVLVCAGCSTSTINLFGTVNKVIVNKTVNQKENKDTEGKNDGSKLEEALKGIDQKGGDVKVPAEGIGE